MPKYLFIAQSDCSAPDREKEFNDWLDQVHVPDVLATPGIIRASRYINTAPEGNKRPKYIQIYEIEIDNIDIFNSEFLKTAKKIEKGGRILNTMIPEKAYPFCPSYYKEVKTIKKSLEKAKK